MRYVKLWVAAIVIVSPWGDSRAQEAPYAIKPNKLPVPASRIQITYGGRIVMDMGNYDVVLGSPQLGPLTTAPGTMDDLLFGGGTVPQVIFKGQDGARWDGGDYLYHPAYPVNLVLRHHYENRVVGQRAKMYPPVAGRPQANSKSTRERQVTGVGNEAGTTSLEPALRPDLLLSPAPLPQADGPAWGQPGWGQPTERPSDMPLAPAADPQREPEAARPLRPSPPLPFEKVPAIRPPRKQRPLTLLNSGVEAISVTLLSPRGEKIVQIPPRQQYTISSGQNWRVRFDTQGTGPQTFRVRQGETYRFSQNASSVWQLRRVPTSPPVEQSKAAAVKGK